MIEITKKGKSDALPSYLGEGEHEILGILRDKGPLNREKLLHKMYLKRHWNDPGVKEGFGQSLDLLLDTGLVKEVPNRTSRGTT